MLHWESYTRTAKTFRSTDEAFRDTDYASWYEKGKTPYTPSPCFVAALTLLGFAATIAAYFIIS